MGANSVQDRQREHREYSRQVMRGLVGGIGWRAPDQDGRALARLFRREFCFCGATTPSAKRQLVAIWSRSICADRPAAGKRERMAGGRGVKIDDPFEITGEEK